jgi:TPR repeat protein
MKMIVSTLIALLLVASPVVAQSSLEADMRTAAAAYEQKDMTTAARLWKVWADKGNAEARTLLGAMYWSGEGVPRDHKEAARLYLLAANQGYARAQNDIGFMLGFEATHRTTMSRPTSGSRSPSRATPPANQDRLD